MATKPPTSPYITDLPLTAEAREAFIEDLFADDLAHPGELFVPGNSFYAHGNTEHQANHMLKDLCVWLGIKPGYIGLEFESITPSSEGQRHTIFIETLVARDELLLGATLAHAIVRYLIEDRKQIQLPDPREQLALITTATIVFGLGIVVANGLNPRAAKTTAHQELLGTLPYHEYTTMFKGFLWQHNIPAHGYTQSLAPWVTNSIGSQKAKKPIAIIQQQYHLQRQQQYQRIGMIWLALLGAGIAIFVLLQQIQPLKKETKLLQEKVITLQNLKQQCDESAAYTKQYTDTTDLQAQRSINANEQQCRSLDNQLKSAQQAYEDSL